MFVETVLRVKKHLTDLRSRLCLVGSHLRETLHLDGVIFLI